MNNDAPKTIDETTRNQAGAAALYEASRALGCAFETALVTTMAGELALVFRTPQGVFSVALPVGHVNAIVHAVPLALRGVCS